MAKEGLTSRLTSGGIPVIRCHYSADHRHDPATPEGAGWLTRIAAGYPLGLRDPGFLQELEIIYGALGGTFLFALWDTLYKSTVVIPPMPLDHLPHAKLYGTYDHGWIHAAAYHVHAVCPDGRKYTLWEFAASQVPMRAIAEIILGRDVQVQDGRRFEGNPYAGKEVVRIADPAIFERRGQTGDDPHASVGDIYREKYGVAMQKGTRGGDLTVASYLIGDLWLDPEHPKYQIFQTCAHLIWELPRLRHKQISSQMARNKSEPEGLVDKDNDCFDSMKQFLRRFPSTVAPKPPQQVAGTFAHAQRLMKARKPLANRYARM